MNDSINTPEKAVKFIERYTNSNPYLMIPFECWNGLNKKDNDRSITYWNNAYKIALNWKKLDKKRVYSLEELKEACNKMTKQVKLRNNKLVLYLLCFVKIFPKLNIRIKDLNMIVSFS